MARALLGGPLGKVTAVPLGSRQKKIIITTTPQGREQRAFAPLLKPPQSFCSAPSLSESDVRTMPSALRMQCVCGTFLLAPLPQLVSVEGLDIGSTFLGPCAHRQGTADFLCLTSELHRTELFRLGVVLVERRRGGAASGWHLFGIIPLTRFLAVLANGSPALPLPGLRLLDCGLPFFFGKLNFQQDHSDAALQSRAINSGANGKGCSMIFS